VLEAVRGVQRYRLSYWDALIWATAKLNGVPNVLSEDFNTGSQLEAVPARTRSTRTSTWQRYEQPAEVEITAALSRFTARGAGRRVRAERDNFRPGRSGDELLHFQVQ
jgi:hypothetical protein